MGFCSDEEYEHFLRICPDSEQGLIEDGIILVKYWLQIDDDEQERRFRARIDDRRRRWKLSPMDSASWGKWVDYSRARDAMLLHTDTDVAPWYIVDANIKRNGRLNVIRHLLDQMGGRFGIGQDAPLHLLIDPGVIAGDLPHDASVPEVSARVTDIRHP